MEQYDNIKIPPRYQGFDQLPINGKWRHGKGAKVLRDLNPYNGDTLIEIPHANRDDMDEAYSGAARAQITWAAALPRERATVMRRAAQVMEARHEEIVEWLIEEGGSTRIKAAMEWETVHAVLLEAATLPYLVEGRILPSDVPGKECRMYRKPVGVVSVISPWNWPLQLSVRSVAPALAVGNAVVLKPASDTPVTGGLLLAKILEEAGLPPGVLSVISGAGKQSRRHRSRRDPAQRGQGSARCWGRVHRPAPDQNERRQGANSHLQNSFQCRTDLRTHRATASRS